MGGIGFCISRGMFQGILVGEYIFHNGDPVMSLLLSTDKVVVGDMYQAGLFKYVHIPSNS